MPRPVSRTSPTTPPRRARPEVGAALDPLADGILSGHSRRAGEARLSIAARGASARSRSSSSRPALERHAERPAISRAPRGACGRPPSSPGTLSRPSGTMPVCMLIPGRKRVMVVVAPVTPGRLRTRSSTCATSWTRRGAIGIAAAPGTICIESNPRASKPGLRRRSRGGSPRSTEGSREQHHAERHLGADEDLPEAMVGAARAATAARRLQRVSRDRCRPGAARAGRPIASAANATTATAKAATRQSRAAPDRPAAPPPRRGRAAGPRSDGRWPAREPPVAARRPASASCSATMRRRLAPSAIRRATSPRRVMACASAQVAEVGAGDHEGSSPAPPPGGAATAGARRRDASRRGCTVTSQPVWVSGDSARTCRFTLCSSERGPGRRWHRARAARRRGAGERGRPHAGGVQSQRDPQLARLEQRRKARLHHADHDARLSVQPDDAPHDRGIAPKRRRQSPCEHERRRCRGDPPRRRTRARAAPRRRAEKHVGGHGGGENAFRRPVAGEGRRRGASTPPYARSCGPARASA